MKSETIGSTNFLFHKLPGKSKDVQFMDIRFIFILYMLYCHFPYYEICVIVLGELSMKPPNKT